MIGPELGQAIFKIAFYITFTSAALAIFWRPRQGLDISAEFVVTSITLFIGLTCLVVIGVIVRRQSH